jgi:hypothetical protein
MLFVLKESQQLEMETVNNYFKNYSYEGVTEKSNGLVYR